MTTAPRPDSGRLAALDGLRAVAAAMVFIHHVQLPGLENATYGLSNGVWVFFVLSGFLIHLPFTRARAQGEPAPLVPYMIRRVLRIYPAYIVASAGIAIIGGWYWYFHVPLDVLAMTQSPVIVSWTLALEVQFYIAVPLIDRIVGERVARLESRILLLATLGVASLGITALAVGTGLLGGGVSGAAIGTIANYFWAFVPGMILAEMFVRRPSVITRQRTPALLGTAACLIGAGAIVQLPVVDAFTVSGAVLAITGLLRLHVAGARALTLQVLGAISYSFYLWHVAVIDLFNRPSTWIASVVALLASVLVAGMVYVAIERPMIALGRRLSGAWLIRRDRRSVVEPSAA